jgi:hypothetical protein
MSFTWDSNLTGSATTNLSFVTLQSVCQRRQTIGERSRKKTRRQSIIAPNKRNEWQLVWLFHYLFNFTFRIRSEESFGMSKKLNVVRCKRVCSTFFLFKCLRSFSAMMVNNRDRNRKRGDKKSKLFCFPFKTIPLCNRIKSTKTHRTHHIIIDYGLAIQILVLPANVVDKVAVWTKRKVVKTNHFRWITS